MDTLERFRYEVARALGGRSPITVAKEAGLSRLVIRQALKAANPRLLTVAAIAKAVGLEIHIGPLANRGPQSTNARNTAAEEAETALREADKQIKRATAALLLIDRD